MLHTAARAVTRSCSRRSISRINLSSGRSIIDVSTSLTSNVQVCVVEAVRSRSITTTSANRSPLDTTVKRKGKKRQEKDGAEAFAEEEDSDVVSADGYSSLDKPREQHEHAVISAFDLFSIGGKSMAFNTRKSSSISLC